MVTLLVLVVFLLVDVLQPYPPPGVVEVVFTVVFLLDVDEVDVVFEVEGVVLVDVKLELVELVELVVGRDVVLEVVVDMDVVLEVVVDMDVVLVLREVDDVVGVGDVLDVLELTIALQLSAVTTLSSNVIAAPA